MQSPQNTSLLKSQSNIAKSLIKGCKELIVLEDNASAPVGCSLYAVEATNIFLLVKGIVDIPQEIEKLEKKRSKIQDLKEILDKKRGAEGYTKNVKDEIKAADESKV